MASNRQAIERRGGAGERSAACGLSRPEEIAFQFLDSADRGSVLDVGAGSGRTTAYLATVFEDYTGIDQSARLIRAAASRFPGRRFQVMDVRALNLREMFDCIVFPDGGIDEIGETDRRIALANIASHLNPGGIFIYATHNLGYERVRIWMKSLLVREMFSGLLPVRPLFRRMRRFRRQRRFTHFAYLNDPASGFSRVTRYADIPGEIEVLHEWGFSVLATIGSEKSDATYDEKDRSVTIVARRD
jgi:SAM-dependent methyltransferase